MIESDLPPREELSEMEVLSPRLIDRIDTAPRAVVPRRSVRPVVVGVAALGAFGLLVVGAAAVGLLAAMWVSS
jgi:hypothetical protein